MTDLSWSVESFRGSVKELCEPHVTMEAVPYWDKSRHRKVRFHRVEHESLLDDLVGAVVPGGGGFDPNERVSIAPGSRPAARLDAIDGMRRIEADVRLWVARVTGNWYGGRGAVRGDLSLLVGLSGGLADDVAGWLARDARAWVTLAKVLSGWDSPAYAPHVECPQCEHVDSLRVRLTQQAAVCVYCGAFWGPGNGGIGVLADHVRMTMEDAR
jgi:hypothetical protein